MSSEQGSGDTSSEKPETLEHTQDSERVCKCISVRQIDVNGDSPSPVRFPANPISSPVKFRMTIDDTAGSASRSNLSSGCDPVCPSATMAVSTLERSTPEIVILRIYPPLPLVVLKATPTCELCMLRSSTVTSEIPPDISLPKEIPAPVGDFNLRFRI